MNWDKLICSTRLGLEEYQSTKQEDRTEFERDYDRLVFSSPFRRLQNKTQVFPLPKTIFVHNRLTHSIEVSCVGRSLGTKVCRLMIEKYGKLPSEKLSEIGTIVSAACLAHDMGNPPFGHSGETAISTYFSEGDGTSIKNKYSISDKQWSDFIHFDGNANAFRLLTHQFEGRRKGGFVLTYSTLASIVKYPYPSISATKNKFGYFDSETDIYNHIADYLGIIKKEDGSRARHPLVYLVEAADDICYEIMDLEDAHKLRLLSTEETKELLLSFFDPESAERKRERMKFVSDINENIVYLRSSIIGILAESCAKVFVDNEEQILNGTFNGSLIDYIPEPAKSAYEKCKKISAEKIYKSKEVVDIEIAGYNIIYTLIGKELDAALSPDKTYSKQLRNRIPEQYKTSSESYYDIIMSVIDYVSGMTDVYALDLYRKIMGISIPEM